MVISKSKAKLIVSKYETIDMVVDVIKRLEAKQYAPVQVDCCGYVALIYPSYLIPVYKKCLADTMDEIKSLSIADSAFGINLSE